MNRKEIEQKLERCLEEINLLNAVIPWHEYHQRKKLFGLEVDIATVKSRLTAQNEKINAILEHLGLEIEFQEAAVICKEKK